jgi:hypothetical protein
LDAIHEPQRRFRTSTAPKLYTGLALGQGLALGKDMLILPEVVFETYGANVATTLKPVFDSVWNAAGKAESPFYDGNKWKGMTKFNPNNPPW